MSVLDLMHRPEVRLRTAYHFDVEAPDAEGMIAFVSPAGRLAPARYDAAFGSALDRLHAGASLAALRDPVLQQAGAGAAGRLLFLLGRFGQQGLLRYEICGEGSTDEDAPLFATLLPQKDDYVPRAALPEADMPLALSRFALLRRDEALMLLESPQAGVRVAIDDPSALLLVHGLARPNPANTALSRLPEAVRPAARTLLGFLWNAGMVVAAPDGATALGRMEEGGSALAQWEFHDLLFHARSRRGSSFDAIGGIFPYIGLIEPLPALRPSWPGERIALARADIETLERMDTPFTAVQEARRSVRAYDETRPITIDQLGRFLFRTARLKRQATMAVGNIYGASCPFEVSWRPYPTGGASYEIELYLVADRCDGLTRGLYHYDSGGHFLVQVSGASPEIQRMLDDAHLATAGQARGQVLLIMAARFQRVAWKYRSMAYTVMLRNAGSLYQTMYLVATAMGLAPCGIGSGNSATFARATGLDPLVEGPVGEFILGGAAAS